MAIQIQLRQGTTTEHNTFTGAVGEVTVDTTKDVIVVHDGTTVGGHPVATRANADGTISLIKKDGTSAGTINALGLFNNTLTSTNTNQALTAAQGKELKDSLNTVTSSSFGVGQTWVDQSSSRTRDTVYTNNTGKPIMVTIAIPTNSGYTANLYCDSQIVAEWLQQSNGNFSLSTIIPNGSNYKLTTSYGGVPFRWWKELR